MFVWGSPQSYVYKVLKDVHPQIGISKKGMNVMEVGPAASSPLLYPITSVSE
jgi:hypothetical protein